MQLQSHLCRSGLGCLRRGDAGNDRESLDKHADIVDKAHVAAAIVYRSDGECLVARQAMEGLHEGREEEVARSHGVVTAEAVYVCRIQLGCHTEQSALRHRFGRRAMGIDSGLRFAKQSVKPFFRFLVLGAAQQRGLVVGPLEGGIFLLREILAGVSPRQRIEEDHGRDTVKDDMMEVHEKPGVIVVAYYGETIQRLGEKVERTDKRLHISALRSMVERDFIDFHIFDLHALLHDVAVAVDETRPQCRMCLDGLGYGFLQPL